MTKPMIRINDGIEIIDREMTDDEFKQWQEVQSANEARIEAIVAAEAAKDAAIAKLAALGLNLDDLKALGF